MKSHKNKDNNQNNLKRDANASLLSDKKTQCRKCIGCGKIFDRSKMMRIMREHKTGSIIINPPAKTFGRSVYICSNIDCYKSTIKKKRIEKNLKTKIDSQTIQGIENIIEQ